jgi:hypothetical protein
MLKTRVSRLVLALITLIGGTVFGVCTDREEAATASGQETSPSPTAIVIDNETLKKYADQGNVTTVEKPRSDRGVRSNGGSSALINSGEDARTAEKRRYWRTMYEKQVALIESLEQQIELLNQEIPALWRDFYSRDDPMYRDGVIKPKLDEALARWDRMTVKLEEERAKLPKIREDARRDGAQPGWFRGVDKPKNHDGKGKKSESKDRLPTDFDVDVVTADEAAP